MINMKTIVYSKLSTLGYDVTDEYPNTFTTKPIIQYTEEDNSITSRYIDRTIQGEYIRFRVDLWGKTSLSNLAIEVDNLMDELGFNRIGCYDVPDPQGIKHKTLRYEIYK